MPSTTTNTNTTTATNVPVDLRERLEVLFWQEMTGYQTHDYLAAFQASAGSPSLGSNHSAKDQMGEEVTSSSPPGEQIKEHWREIICEWAYNCKCKRNNS